MKSYLVTSGILFCFIILSCNNLSSYSNYLGTWQQLNYVQGGWGNSDRFTISKNGDLYVLEGRIGGFDPAIYPLTSDNGKLILKGIPVMGDLSLEFINDGKTLLFGGKKFEKL